MATVYKIHPAIGIARVGNSPDEFFVGPERIGEYPEPAGGFKDPQCRVKRQAARFHIFAHHDDGTFDEITDEIAEITWSVHLVNKKAAHPARGNSEPASNLTIDPGSRILSGPNQRQLFDTGTISFSGAPVTTVPLGEIRSNDDNHLLVLGSHGHSGSPSGTPLSGYFWSTVDWYDDVSDGPVTATIELRADGDTPPVEGAWVVVAPPKFAPHIDNVITLYDRVFQTMADAGMVTTPTTTSYTNDIYPILQRASDTPWVEHIWVGHSWTHPVAPNTMIFNRLKVPGGGGGNMPDINDSGSLDDRLTPIQYAHMERWKNNTHVNDWTGPPAVQADITPDGLDRAALDACVGGAFYPGIEAGGLPADRPIIDASNYTEAFRLDHTAIDPGDITNPMALPWQNDFYQCGNNWWPVPRPNEVNRGGLSNQSWTIDPSGSVANAKDMVDKWGSLGFVVRQGSQHVESERCATPSITLLTPLLNFQDVPQGPMGMVREVPLAITFEVIAPSGPLTLEYAPGGGLTHPQLVASNSTVTVGPTAASAIATARLWVIYKTGANGSVLAPQTVKVQRQGTTQQWTITIIGNTVGRKTAATALTLDRSGSMSETRGDGVTKHVSLQQAAGIFVDVMLEGDGAGIVSFNHDAQVLQSVLPLGSGGLSDLNRATTKDIINGPGLNPSGATSIGDGIFESRGILNSAGSFDVKALVVLTDGVENSSRYIADVAPQINEQTYSIGFGTPQNTSAPALQAVSGNHGGFLLITGAIGTDNRFLLQKYFLQILAGISNAEIVLDPDGQLLPGQTERVPFRLIRGDAGVDVILLTPYTDYVDFRLETPSGQIIQPWFALADPGMHYVRSTDVTYYRLVLPYEFMVDRFDHEGTWHALLSIGRPRVEREGDDRTEVDHRNLRDASSLRDLSPSRLHRLGVERTSAASSSVAAASSFMSASAGTSQGRPVRTLPYSLVVHSYSNLSLHVRAEQHRFDPGATVGLHATLAESGIPLESGARVWVDVTRPDGTTTVVDLIEQEAGRYTVDFATTIVGVYRFRVRASGATRRGETFARERTLTAGVWSGGDRDAELGHGGHDLIDYLRDRDERLCDLIGCLTDGEIGRVFEEQFHSRGIDLNHLRRCLERWCRQRRASPEELG